MVYRAMGCCIDFMAYGMGSIDTTDDDAMALRTKITLSTEPM